MSFSLLSGRGGHIRPFAFCTRPLHFSVTQMQVTHGCSAQRISRPMSLKSGQYGSSRAL